MDHETEHESDLPERSDSDPDRDEASDGVEEPTEDEAQGELALIEELDEEALERRRQALAQIRQWGDPILRSTASEVSEFGPALEVESQQMIELMRDALGVGLAATQLGALRRVLVYQAGLEVEPVALVNPRIEWRSDETEVAEEGCLSLPGVTVDVERSARVRVSARSSDGSELELEAEGLEARVIQHEVDHLDGVLILDRTVPDQRRGAVVALREGGTFEPADLLPDPEPEADPEAAAPPPAER